MPNHPGKQKQKQPANRRDIIKYTTNALSVLQAQRNKAIHARQDDMLAATEQLYRQQAEEEVRRGDVD